MINKMFAKISMLIVLPVILGSISVRALANTAPVWNYTTSPEVEDVTIDTDLYSPQSFIIEDMNGDNYLDVLILSRSSVIWYDSANNWKKNIIIDGTTDQEQLAVGDMDGDGDIDVVTSSKYDDKIYLYENGNQWAKTTIVSSNYPKSINIADIDGDGDLDIVSVTSTINSSTNILSDTLVWYENGNEWAQEIIKVHDGNERFNNIIVADMDGDGDLDILHSFSDSRGIEWAENGDEWDNYIVLSSWSDGSTLATAVAVADMNSDGDLDVLFGDVDTIYWIENGSKTTIDTGLSSVKDLEVADINGDGNLDVLSALYNYGGSYTKGAVNWYQNANWSEGVIAHRDNIEPIGVLAADIDRDGDMDVISLNYTVGASSYELTAHMLEGYDTTIPVYVEAVDGLIDIPLPLVAYDSDSDPLSYSLAGIDSALFKVTATGIISFTSTPNFHLFSDFNKDNVFEITLTVSDGVSSVSKDIKIGLTLGEDSDDDGVTDAQELFDGTDPDDYNSKLDTDGDGVPDQLELYYGDDINTADAIDTDGDGVIDYIEQFYGENDAPVWLSKINNAEHWEEKDISATTDSYSYSQSYHVTTVADITGDGVKDIVSNLNYSLTLFNGANDFSTTVIDDAVSNIDYITAADLTNDGVDNPNVIISQGTGYYSSDYNIYWYEHNTWIKRPITTSDDINGDIKVYDMDSDGDLDIVTVTKTQVVWYENGNTWLKHIIIDSNFSIYRFEMVDFDLDGDIDIVATTKYDDGIIWFENNITWQKHTINNTIELPDTLGLNGLAVKDIDGNGSLDIVVSSADNTFTLLQNINGWQETTLYTFDDSDTTRYVTISDINNDGVLDIVGSTYSTLIWFNGADDWSKVLINESFSDRMFIVEDLTGDSYKDVIGTDSNTSNSALVINVNTNTATRYSFDVPDLSPEILFPFVAVDPDGQDLTYSVAGNDAKYFKVNDDGILSFVSQLSLGLPVDFDGNNIFDIYLVANDGSNQSVVTLALTLVESIDFDGDGILDTYDIDDDNDLVPDTVEIAEGTDPLDANSFLDEDKNGVPDFVQRSEALYINYQFPLGVSVDEGGFSVVDLSNVTSENGPVSITVSEVQGLNYKFRDNVLYIYADYVSANKIVNIDITLSDGIETIKHVFPVRVMNVSGNNFKIELIKEAKASSTGIRFQVVVKNIPTLLDYKWYIDGELLSSEQSQIFTLQEPHFQQEDIVIKVEVSVDGFVSSYSDGLEVNRTLFLAEVEQAQQEEIEVKTSSTKNVAGSVNFISLMSIVFLLLLRRLKSKVFTRVKELKIVTVFRRIKLLLTSLIIVALSACSNTTDTKYELSAEQNVATQTVNISLDKNDPLYMAKLEYEAKKEQAKLEKLKREAEIEISKRNERVHILTIGF